MRKSNPKLAAELFPKKKKSEKIDTVSTYNRFYDRNQSVLMDAFNSWWSLDSFRDMADRNTRYTFGDQLADKVLTKKGYVSERSHILSQGVIPLQNNRIRGIVRSVLGVYQSQKTDPVCVARDREEQSVGEIMSTAIQYVYQLNKMWGLDSSAFTDMLVAGMPIFRSDFGWRNGKMDVWTDKVPFKRFFFDNHIKDPRMWDVHLVGELHDWGLYDVISRFAKSREDASKIKDLYSYCDRESTVEYLESITEDSRNRKIDFFNPDDETRCRVIEVWRKESKDRYLCLDTETGEPYKIEIEDKKLIDIENDRRRAEQSAQGILPENMKLIETRWFVDRYFYYYFLTPMGDVLEEGETPYWHDSHPYCFRIYPFFDGKVYPFVGDFIDQQKYINRLIQLQDFVTRSSAKGVLAVDKQSIPDGVKVSDYTSNWADYNGVILYTSKNGAEIPKQIVNSSTTLGVTEMLQIQLKLLEDISGVHGALQGQTPNSGTPAALYAQQIQNSATSLNEFFEIFRELKEDRDYKNMKLIQQYYDQPRYIRLTGSNKPVLYDPKIVKNAELELSITESTATPVYRLVINDLLMQLYSRGAIDVKMLLKHGAFPFADSLLQDIESQERTMAEQQSSGFQSNPNNQEQQSSNFKVNPAIQNQLTGEQQSPIMQKILSNNYQEENVQ